ncbi:MAG: DUF3553 domain-containing protein [Geobacter sp.]|nr:DUF3553 domain-containing protein [Geobacter sp.]
MTFKPGNIVSHSEAQEWGAGKVLEVTINRVTIQFSDGISRKIAASHYTCLVPASESAYLPPPRKSGLYYHYDRWGFRS